MPDNQELTSKEFCGCDEPYITEYYRDSGNTEECRNCEKYQPLLSSNEKIKLLKKQLTATQQALDTAVEALEWKPIETAPKDGTRILGCGYHLFKDRHDIDIIQWVSNLDIIEFEGFTTGQILEDGKLFSLGLNDFYTHWMPLPTPPKAALASIKE